MPAYLGDAGDDLRSTLLPAELLPLFDDRFVRSCDLIEEYIFRLVARIAREMGLAAALAEGGSVAEIARRAGLDPVAGPPLLDWLLRLLAERGAIARSDTVPVRFQTSEP
ncbi:MAG: hypothetical protein H6R48_923, partial [Proteobacteria bacterium]|nr:hypothetical protein [Pseudomonadota bacterium]